MLRSGKHNGGVWVAIENRGEADQDAYWVGKALRVVKVYDKSGSIGRVRYDVGDMEIEVRWMERAVTDSERRTFTNWGKAEAGRVYTFNSTELRHMDHDGQKILSAIGRPELNVVQRRMTRSTNREVHTVRAEPPGTEYTISASDENVVLGWCIG
jgi:hypothetical protein